MRSTTLLSYGLVLFLPAFGLLGACDSEVDTVPSGGSGGSTTTSPTGGATTTTTTGGGGIGGTGGVGATGGTGGTGGFLPPENDACEGQLITPAVDGAAIMVEGTLNGAVDDYQTFCADMTPVADAPDVVYQLEIPADVTATFSVAAVGFEPVLSLRKTQCVSREGSDVCLVGAGGAVQTKTALGPGKVWLVVDSADGKAGDFTLSVQLTAPKCGDGVVNPGEKCDPATPTSEDGCFNPGTPDACNFGEPPPDPALVQCPGGLITIGKGDAFQLALLNNGAGGKNHENVVDAVDCVSPATGPENIFNIKPTGSGTLTATVGHWEDGTLYCDVHPPEVTPPICADFIMYLRKGTCASSAAADQLACSDYTVNPNSPFGYDELLMINVPVTANTDYWLFVDGLDDLYGIGGYYLELSLQ